MDKQMKVALIYRKNDLFDKYIDLVRTTLTDELGEGFDLEQAFPLGTPPEEISQWFVEKKGEIYQYEVVLCDETCKGFRNEVCQSYKESFRDILDYCFGRSAHNLINAEFSGVSDLERQLENQTDKSGRRSVPKDLIGKLLEETRRAYIKVMQEVKEKPRTILIMENYLYAHYPFSMIDGKNAGHMLQEWFIEGGVPTVYRVHDGNISVKNGENVEAVGTANWVIYDRHAERLGSGYPEIKVAGDATILHLPFDNFVSDLVDNGLIDFSEETFRKSIEQQVRRMIKRNK